MDAASASGLIDALRKVGVTKVAAVIVVAAFLIAPLAGRLSAAFPELNGWIGNTGFLVVAAAIAWLVVSMLQWIWVGATKALSKRAQRRHLSTVIAQLDALAHGMLRAAVEGSYERINLDAVARDAERQGIPHRVTFNSMVSTGIMDDHGFIAHAVFVHLLAHPHEVGARVRPRIVRRGW